jgi:hypothetical protein
VGGRGKERTRVQSKWRSALHSYLCVGDNHDRFPGHAAEKEAIRHDEQLIAMAPRAEGGEGRSTRTPVLPHSTTIHTRGKGLRAVNEDEVSEEGDQLRNSVMFRVVESDQRR